MKNIVFVLLCTALMLSCKKKKETTTEPENTGTISGKTTQYNQYGDKLTAGLNGVTVSLDNDDVTATTDDAGNYSLQGVKPGIYTLFYSKPGCNTYQLQQVNFPGNGTLYKDGTVIEQPTFEFLSATAVLETSPTHGEEIKVNLKLNSNPKALGVACILGTSDGIDINGSNYYGPFVNQIPANTTDFSFTTHYTSNGNIYIKIYTYSGNSNSYHDYGSNTNPHQGYGASLPVIKVK